MKVLRQGSGIRKEAVYVVLEIPPEGKREVLGFLPVPHGIDSSVAGRSAKNLVER